VKEARKVGDKEDITDIEYELEQPPNFKVGDQVEVKIDAERRGKIRRLHSAAHVLHYVVEAKLGSLTTIGSNITVDKARMDWTCESPMTKLIPEFEAQINNYIQENKEVIMEPDDSKPDLKWWTCGDWKMPCGGTHVKALGEIGQVKLKRKNIGKGKERIEITLI